MLGNTSVKVLSQGKTALTQATRNMSAVSGPPTVKISFIEKAMHGGAIFVGLMAVPAWVLVNLQSYKGEK